MATTTSPLLKALAADGWRRVVFMYVGPGKRRQWAARLGTPGRPVGRFVTGLAGGLSILLSLFIFYLIARIATYGVFWVEGQEADAWGGPTLARAWVGHALIAAPAVALAMWLLVPVTNLVIRGLDTTAPQPRRSPHLTGPAFGRDA